MGRFHQPHMQGQASQSPERRRQISSMGGKASQASGNAYRFNSETARMAGIKSGETRRRNKLVEIRQP